MIPSLPRLVLGTSNLGLHGSREDAFRLLDAFWDLGGRVLDTAAVYSDWVPGQRRRSESLIGDWLRTQPSARRPFIATKGAHPPLDDMHAARLDRDAVVADVEGSLAALGVDRLDLFYLHRDDLHRPVEDIASTLAGLVSAGKIAHVGLSNWSANRVQAFRATGIVAMDSAQVLGNILSEHMGPLADATIVRLDPRLLADGEQHHTSVLLFSSQAGGLLSRPDSSAGAPYRTPAAQDAATRIRRVAADLDVDPTTLAVAFLLAFSPSFYPIVGCRTVEQLQRSFHALETRVPEAVITELAAISGYAALRSGTARG